MLQHHILGVLAVCVAAAVVSAHPAANERQSSSVSGAVPGLTRTETKHLTIATASAAADRGRYDLFIDVAPKPKMHVYAPEQKDVIPITLKLATDESVRTQALKYPKPEKYFFAPLKETQFVYSKPFRITQPVTLAAAGQVTITGTVRYQACDDSICYLPQNVPVSWTVVVK